MYNEEFDILELNEAEKPYNIKHRCYYFAKEIIFLIKEHNFERIYYSLFDQLIRSSTSIGANLVEGRAGSSKKDWKNFYTIALKSSNEAKYWLCLIRDTMNFPKTKIEELIKEVDEISKIIASIIINSN